MTTTAMLQKENDALRQQVTELENQFARQEQTMLALRENESRLQAVLNNLLDAPYRRNLRTDRYDYLSPIFEQLTGWPAEEMNQTDTETVLARIHPADLSQVQQEIERTNAHCQEVGRATGILEYRFRTKAGDYRWLGDYLTVVAGEDGQPLYRLGVVRDITTRKQIEAEHQAHLRFLISMDQVNRAIQGTNDLEQMMSEVLDVVLSIFDCDRAFLVHPCNPAAAAWRVPMESTKPEYPGALAVGLEIPMTPPVAETFRTLLVADGPVKFGPETPYPLPADVSERFGFKSLIAMTLYPKAGQPWQFGLHQCAYARIWPAGEERLFQEIGRRLTDALTSLLQYRDLRDSERRLTEAQRIAHIGYWERDLEAGRITLSDEACRVFGLAPQDFPPNLEQWHQRWLELIHPEDRGRAAQTAAEALRDGPPYNLQYRIIRPNGEVRFIHSEAVVNRAESGRPRSMLGMMQDITDRKQAEAALRESEERFRLFMDNSPTIAWIKDEGGRLVYLNRTYENRYGMRLADWFGKTDFDVWSAEVAEQFRQSDQAVLAAGHEIQYTEKILNPDGSLSAWWTFKFPLRDAAGQRYVAGIGLDITERQQAEEKLLYQANLLQNVSDAIIATDLDFKIISWNQAAETIYGWPAAEVIGQPITDLLPTTYAVGTHEQVLQQFLAQGFWQDEASQKRKDGSWVTVLASVSLIKDSAGQPVGVVAVNRDITARKQAEAALRASEERFRLFMDNSPTIAWIKDEGGRYVYVDRTYEKHYGVRLADWFGKTDFEVWPAEVAEEFRQSDLAVLAAGHGIEYTPKLLNPDGSFRVWWTFKFPLRDAAGQRYVAGIGLDITERQQIETELRQTNERFTQLAESIEEVFWVFDLRERQILYLSPAYETIWGWPRENVYQNPNFFIETVFPDDLPLVRAAREGELRGERASWEYRIQRPDGSIRWLWERSFPIFDDAGQLIRLTGVASDITERKQMETKLRQWADAFENCAHGLALGLPATNQILTCNPAYARLQGRTIAEISGTLILSAYAPEDHALVRQSIAEADRTGCVRYEARMVRKDGSLYPVQMDVVSVRDTNGNLLYRVITQQDISERKAAEEAQTKLEAQLRQAQKLESIGRLAGGVAHDFNNLLTVILGYTDLIQVQLPSHDPLQEKLAQVQRAAEQAEALTQQLLAFSRKQILAPVVLDLNELVGNLHKMLGRLIGEHITLATALQPGLRAIKADPGQIEQVLLNLAVNARDAMPQGGRLTIQTVNVQLEGVNVPGGGPGVLLAVTDTGHGMDETILAHIFEPFFTTKEQGKGTGLGLATVYGIVKQSGGEIIVESQPGQGTTFKIYLPADQAAVARSTSPQPQQTARAGYETILLVEDNPMVRNLVRVALRNYGYTLLEAEQGQQALALAAQQEGVIDLLLTDVIMPEMSGREVAERLKALYPHIKVLFMSGYTDDEVIQHGLLTAEVEFISKPFSTKTLAAKVREILDA